jgi:Sec-independent protein secretion pathway component TatC
MKKLHKLGIVAVSTIILIWLSAIIIYFLDEWTLTPGLLTEVIILGASAILLYDILEDKNV